jgi:hypothetical protein
MNDLIEQVKYNGFTIQIFPDDDPENPRNWDNLGHMVCWHKRYDLGDKHDWNSPQDFLGWSKEQKGRLFLLPLYLYDHSGITMSTSPFSCSWDSGQVGYIYVTRDKVLREFKTKCVMKALRERVKKVLESEVVVYDRYLIGGFVGYIVLDMGGEHVDSCWGFEEVEHAISSAKEVVDALPQMLLPLQLEAAKVWAEEQMDKVDAAKRMKEEPVNGERDEIDKAGR